jgi:hypothetical protein
MTLKEFIAKYDGKFVEYHSFSAGATNQCVDLANQYIVDVLGFSAIIGTNAQDFPKKAGSNFTYILNTPTGQPEPGDLMIFKSADGVGHISIHIKNISLSLFTSLDQNYPSKSPCKEVNHNYTNVLGWLRAKGVTTENIDQLKKDLAESNKTKDNLQTQVNGLLVDIKSWESKYNECNTQRIEAGSSSDGFRSQLNTLVAQLASKLGTRQEVPEILASVDTCLEFEDKAVELEKKLDLEAREHQADIDSFGKEILSLKSQLASLEIKYKELKDTQTTPTQPTPKYSILEYILKLIRR